jgi:hypothetical protein
MAADTEINDSNTVSDPTWQDIVIRALGDSEWEKLTACKIHERGTLVAWDSNEIVFECERHLPILGEQYRSGHAMANFITWFPRYGLDLRSNMFSTLECVRDGHVEIADARSAGVFDYSFKFEPLEANEHTCTESNTGRKCIVKSRSEVRKFADDIANGFDNSFVTESWTEYRIPADEVTRVNEILDQAERADFVETALRAWDEHLQFEE